MDEFDENICEIYKKTNNEIIELLKKSQESYCKSNYKSNLLLTLCILFLSVSVIAISILGYCYNQKWLETFNSYEYATEATTYTQDGNGQNSINNGFTGDLINGADIIDNKENDEKEK